MAERQPEARPFRFLVGRPDLAKFLEHCLLILGYIAGAAR